MTPRLSEDFIRDELASGYDRAKIALSPIHLEHLVNSYYDPAYFNTVVLGRPPFYYKQFEMADLVVNHKTSVIVTGNAVGKSHFVGSIALWYFCTRPFSKVITTAPTANSLREIVWGNIKDAYRRSRLPIGGHLVASPLDKLSYSEHWYLIGISTTKTEKMSGHHSPYVCVIADEASGVETEIFTAISSLGYDKFIMTGNPLRLDGFFYDEAIRAINGHSQSGFLQIASTDGPHAKQETSEWGMCCQSWLREMADRYGKNSIWWQSHIEGRFPDSNEDAIIPADWLNRLGQHHVKAGPIKITVDIAEGTGEDDTVIMVLDNNGIFEYKQSNTMKLEQTAKEVKMLSLKYQVEPRHITYDRSGLGADFQNRLNGVQLMGCRGFKGKNSAPNTSVGVNMRSHAAWAMHQRLDPNRNVFDKQGKAVKQVPFYIPPDLLSKIRPELQALSYSQQGRDKIACVDKKDIKKRLGKSPDLADALLMAFAYR